MREYLAAGAQPTSLSTLQRSARERAAMRRTDGGARSRVGAKSNRKKTGRTRFRAPAEGGCVCRHVPPTLVL